jgi:hypothetical protein
MIFWPFRLAAKDNPSLGDNIMNQKNEILLGILQCIRGTLDDIENTIKRNTDGEYKRCVVKIIQDTLTAEIQAIINLMDLENTAWYKFYISFSMIKSQLKTFLKKRPANS